jgi:hypothetical protein
MAFARACGESAEELRQWDETWSRASRASLGGPLVPGVNQGAADRDLRSAEPELGCCLSEPPVELSPPPQGEERRRKYLRRSSASRTSGATG